MPTTTSKRPAPGAARSRTSEAGQTTAAKRQKVLSRLLEDVPDTALDSLIEVTGGGGETTVDSALWGPDPGAADTGEAVLANLRKLFSGRRQLAAASITRAQAAELLGMSEQAVTDALEAHRLLGFKNGRRWLIPAWQLDPETERGVLPGIAEVADHFPGGLVALSDWVCRANPDLDGASPRDALAAGAVAQVVQLSATLTAAGW